MARKPYRRVLLQDFFVIAFGLGVALLLVHTGILAKILLATEGMAVLSSFLAGLFLSSSLTIAIAAIAFVHIAHTAPLLVLAFNGAIGAAIGDLFVLFYLKDKIGSDIALYAEEAKYTKLIHFFHLGSVRWLAFIIGVIAVALPIPDEFGLMMLSLSKVKTYWMLPIAFITSFIEILLILQIASWV